MAIYIYSKPACVQCNATYRFLEALHLKFEVINLQEESAALKYVRNLGYTSAPVVTVTDGRGRVIAHWSGFRPDRLEDINRLREIVIV